MSTISLRAMTDVDQDAVAALIFSSTNAWYEANGRPPIFSGAPSDVLLFCHVYEDLDPGCCILAVDDDSGRIAGSCFYHPRLTHVSLGIMNVDPAFFGCGVARRLLGFITDFADEKNLPTRLVSSAINLDSFSLYSRAGFVPRAVYQDMILTIPNGGPVGDPPAGVEQVRPARPDDAAAMAQLESELVGIDRLKDFEYFLADERKIWHTVVHEGADGAIDGFLVSVYDPGSHMLGPGVMRDQGTAASLIYKQLQHHAGRTPVWLVPVEASELVATLYRLGARNCELHLGQVRGDTTPASGIVMPTFMPETA
jgi:GNAT superfamily N-acetyltransferase